MASQSIPFQTFISPGSRKLNIGCGRRFHSDWINLDLRSSHADVVECDITQGLPFDANSFDAVYHSHVLEHLVPDEGRRLIEECFRVLKPGGVLRIVIPDLERIARLYLQLHRRAWDGDDEAMARYTWIKLELLDQLVRQQSGGMMGRYITSLDRRRETFVRSRIGAELDYCRPSASETVVSEPKPKAPPKKRKSSRTWRERMCRRVIKWLMGRNILRTFDEAMFRKNGEIHRWMYDRFSLRQLCMEIGFTDFQVCSATESRIESFTKYRLDAEGDRAFKPDSLFVECQKANVANANPTPQAISKAA